MCSQVQKCPTVLLVTNDFPPRIGGIQSYLRDYISYLDPDRTIVFASTQDAEQAREWDSQVPYTVVRYPHSVMLPTPDVKRTMQELIREYEVDTVWFGAAAPLGILGKAAKAVGAKRVVVTTHGHEVGWSMVPVARQILGLIGKHADAITYIAQYTQRRFKKAFETYRDPSNSVEWVWMPSGVDTQSFHPASSETIRRVRTEFGLAEDVPLIVCSSRLVPRKGQDSLIRALQHIPDAHLVIVGEGRYRGALEVLAQPVAERVHFTGRVSLDRLVDVLGAADIYAMPARTRGWGLDVEGLGIVYLEAQACGVSVVVGSSGGAPETVTPDSAVVVDGQDISMLIDVLSALIADPTRREAMGKAGRKHVENTWAWQNMAAIVRDVMRIPGAENA